MSSAPSQANSRRRNALAFVATLASALALQGCRKDMAAVQQAPIVDGNDASDPANANMAAPLISQQAVYTTSARGSSSGSMALAQQGTGNNAPVRSTRNEAFKYNTQPPAPYAQSGGGAYADPSAGPAEDAYGSSNEGSEDQLYNDLLSPDTPIAQQPPPPLPVYQQPVAPGPDYLWTPGYWNYASANYGNPAGYYYVPGNWVSTPFAGALWTPGWWGYTGRGYGWHHGYWGRHVGYYGGINYGFGFIGIGYQGGYWNHDHFFYNQDCNHVEPRVVDNYVYQRNVTVINNTYINNSRTSYYGGQGGLQRRPVLAEFAAQREVHIAPLPAQRQEREQASANRQQFFGSNDGHPAQVFAAHPILERNVTVPPQLAHPPQSNGGQPGVNGDQFRQQQGTGQQQQQAAQQHLQQQQNLQQQQRNQQQVAAQQLQQQHNLQQQQTRQLQNGQQQLAHNAEQQVRLQQEQKASQATSGQQQQRNAQQQQLRSQQNQQHSAQQEARVQQNQQRTQQQQLGQQQRLGQQQQLGQQQEQQRSAQQQQARAQQARSQQNQQRAQQQEQGARQQQQASQQQAAHQEQHQPQQARPQPQPHVEAAASAPQAHPQGGQKPRR